MCWRPACDEVAHDRRFPFGPGSNTCPHEKPPAVSRTKPPIWLRFMFPSVPGFGPRIWMIRVRAFGWLTDTQHAAMTCVDCSVEGIKLV